MSGGRAERQQGNIWGEYQGVGGLHAQPLHGQLAATFHVPVLGPRVLRHQCGEGFPDIRSGHLQDGGVEWPELPSGDAHSTLI